ESAPPAFVGCHQLYGQVLCIAKVDDRAGQIEAAHHPSGEEVTRPGVAGDLEVIDVAEEGSVRVTFEQSGEQVPPGLQPPPRQLGDGRPTGDRVQAGERIGLIADHPCVDDHSVGRFEQGIASVEDPRRQPHGDGEVGKGERQHQRIQVEAPLAPHGDDQLLDGNLPAATVDDAHGGRCIQTALAFTVVFQDEYERARRMSRAEVTYDVEVLLRLVAVAHDDHEGEHARACRCPFLVAAHAR